MLQCQRSWSLKPVGTSWFLERLSLLPLYSDAGRIAHLDPDRAGTGSIGAIDTLRHDTLGTKPANVREHRRAVLGDVLVKQDSRLGIAQKLCQRSDVEEELRGRGTASLRRCREADRQKMLGLATVENTMAGGTDECQAETNAIRVP
jgi:hypothetical protein